MNYFMVYDFETDGVDPHTCQPVQIACKAIDPYSLTWVEGSEFCSDMRPEGIDDESYFTESVDKTIKWHTGVQRKSYDEVVARWKDAPDRKQVWKNFVQHVNKYNPKKSQGAAPYACGMNIKRFDNIIADRLNQECRVKRLFNYEMVDLRDLFFCSLIWDDSVRSRTMERMKEYFGLPTDNRHDALGDVEEEGQFVMRYLKFFKNTFDRNPNPYKNCMKPKQTVQEMI